jgi:hypothetical protein
MKQEIINVCIMNGALNLNFNKLTIPGILSLVYILNFILLVPALKV